MEWDSGNVSIPRVSATHDANCCDTDSTVLFLSNPPFMSTPNFFGDKVRWKKFKEGLREIASEHKPGIILIEKSWCPVCKKVGARFQADEEFVELSRQFVMIACCDDDEPNFDEFRPGSFLSSWCSCPRRRVLSSLLLRRQERKHRLLGCRVDGGSDLSLLLQQDGSVQGEHAQDTRYGVSALYTMGLLFVEYPFVVSVRDLCCGRSFRRAGGVARRASWQLRRTFQNGVRRNSPVLWNQSGARGNREQKTIIVCCNRKESVGVLTR